jgi:hypothetical protein
VSDSKIVSRAFAEDFEIVAKHYGLRELGEYETAKAIARNDLENAIPCYAEMAKFVRAVE